jgi:NADH:ubiquinone oxidoreductase subunit E
MDKITVQICVGTTCYVMGASDLQMLGELLPEHLRDKVDIKGARCLGFCKDRNSGRAPFVVIDGEMMSEATVPKVIERIEDIAKRKA